MECVGHGAVRSLEDDGIFATLEAPGNGETAMRLGPVADATCRRSGHVQC